MTGDFFTSHLVGKILSK